MKKNPGSHINPAIEKLPENARNLALVVFLEIETNHDNTATEILSRFLGKSELDNIDRALCKELVFGVLRQRKLLDFVIDEYLKTKSGLKPEILNILRLGAYQSLFLDKIPSHAIVNEAVKAASQIRGKRQSGFVNAVLRKITRLSLEEIKCPDRRSRATEFLAVRYSHPEWLVNKFIKQYGVEDAEKLLIFNNAPPPTTLRINPEKTSLEKLIDWIQKNHLEKAELEKGRYSPVALSVKYVPIHVEWAPLKNGWAYIQDEAAQLVGLYADPSPGMRIVDYCAAPGGKLTHIAQICGDKCAVIGLDIDKKRIRKIKENCARLGLENVRAEMISQGILEELKKKPADIVLTDVPCTGAGIIRRQPDLKWKKDLRSLKRLNKVQGEILENSAKIVRPGGLLVYSTCSILREENEDVIESFLEKRPDFEIDKECGRLNKEAAEHFLMEKGLRGFPPVCGIDGFYAVRLRKSA